MFKHREADADGPSEVDRLISLSLADRAAELLQVLAGRLTQDGRPCDAAYLLQTCFGVSGLPAADDRRFASVFGLNEALQALVATRMLVRIESDFASHRPSYWTSADGAAALKRGDALDVISRRLPT